MSGLWFEEFEIGHVFTHPWRRTVTEYDNMLFSNLTMNVQPLHIDFEFAKATEFGKPLVNSLFTLGLMIGMTVNDTTLGTTVANLGMSDVRFPKPVFHGDTIHVTTLVKDKRTSASRPRQGIVTLVHNAYNQHDDLVGICERAALMHCKPDA
ncbi:MaoC family dehydratase [Sphingosinicella sp. LY1275]|uniref:MaoC family dehydratase n=1 Tax=Sphingosinicella sp. LY1275 TaxID=3095379 RepID=UPI002ADEF5F1|nr:MaoC family dehydratase [Sphingosinicella sp. LY1275]MEA1015360.1 MaoC family dehydratase [Sphingosinicella sp. LY1275]